MKKHKNYAEVNTSFTSLYIISAIGLSWVFSSLFDETKNASFLTTLLFALLVYFIWDLIKQLYSAGQAVFLFMLTFLILPFLMNWLLDFPYARLGAIVFGGAYIVAGILELIYEGLVKKRTPKNFLRRLVNIDNSIDKSIIKISNKHVQTPGYSGISIAFILITVYFTFSYLLFHR